MNIGGATGTAAPKLDLTCYGLSSQIAKSTAPSEPGLKGTATTPLTVTLVASFKPPATGTYTTAQLGTCSYRADGSSTLLQAPGAIATTCPAGQVITPAGTCIADPTLTLQTSAGTAAPEITDLVWDAANPGKFNLMIRYNGPRPPLVPYTQFTLSFPGPGTPSGGGVGVATGLSTVGKVTSATPTSTLTSTTALKTGSAVVGRQPASVGTTLTPSSTRTSGGSGVISVGINPGLLQSLTPYNLPAKDELKAYGPFDVGILGGTLCQKGLPQLAGFIPACTATTASITSKLEIYTSLSPAGYLSTTPVTVTCPALAPTITIADARVLAPATAGANPTLVVDFRNSGGAVLTTSVAASKKFTFTLKNTAVTPNKTATTAAITVPAPATTTTASPAVNFFTLAPACVTPGTKVSANLSVTAATTAPTVAPAAFTKLVEYTCPTPPPPAIAIGNVAPLTLKASGTNFTAPFTVEYSNTGGAPAANQTFTMTVKATSVSTNGGPALALTTALSPVTLTIPASTASPKPTTQIADLFALTGATKKCGVTGITSVKASLSITTAVGTTTSAAVAKNVTVTCPAPKITITNIIPENNTQLSFLLEYKNTGTVAATGQTFGVMFTNVNKGTGLGYPNLAIPAPNAKATARFQVGALGTACNVATPIKVTPSIAAAGYVYSATVTIPCK